MRLLYVHGNYIDSESANIVQVFNMCQAFVQCGVKVTLAIPAPSGKLTNINSLVTSILGQDPLFQIEIYKKFTVAGRFNILGNYISSRKIFESAKVDFCFVRDPLLMHLSLKSGLPTVFESHGHRLHESSTILNRLWTKNVLLNANNKSLLRFVTISQALADFWQIKGVPKHKIITLHDGFNPQIFGIQKTQVEARQDVGLPKEQKIVIYAGSLKPDRHIERIIQLAAIFPDVLFVIVGGPDKRKVYYEELSNKLEYINVIWKGHIPHAKVATYLQSADVLLMLWSWDVPTIDYCSPMKVFEYMASGRIIVGEAFPTILEVLTDGKDAYLAIPDSFNLLVQKLRTALNQENHGSMAAKSRNQALRKYTWTNRAKKIIESLVDLL